MDAVLRTPAGILLLDWKTGSMINATEQLKWYGALYLMKSPESHLEARAINLFDSETIMVEQMEISQNWLYSKAKALLELVKLAQDNPNRLISGQQCNYCPYAQGCNSSKAKARFMFDTLDGEVITLA